MSWRTSSLKGRNSRTERTRMLTKSSMWILKLIRTKLGIVEESNSEAGVKFY